MREGWKQSSQTDTMLRWVSTTPLGRDVVPEVYEMVAAVLGEGGVM